MKTEMLNITEKKGLTKKKKEIYYPESDGKPVAETDVHRDLMFDLITLLKDFFHDKPDVYVSGNLFIYYKEGEPAASVSPNCFVVKGVENYKRRTYKIWEEGKTPDVVFELTSKKTKQEDQSKKKVIYQDKLKVKEYFLYDPLHDYLKPSLQGYRLEGGRYEEIAKTGNRLRSVELGMDLAEEDGVLNLYDVRTGRRILRLDEVVMNAREAALKAEEKALLEATARKEAEEKALFEATARKVFEERLLAELHLLKAENLALKQQMDKQ
jgi:Uma2 family endonuclease